MSDYVNEHVESCSKWNFNLTSYYLTEFYGLLTQLDNFLTICLEKMTIFEWKTAQFAKFCVKITIFDKKLTTPRIIA